MMDELTALSSKNKPKKKTTKTRKQEQKNLKKSCRHFF